MIRFILKHEGLDNNNGQEWDFFETVDIDLPILQNLLERGGRGPSGYDQTKLIGVEILMEDEK